MRTASPTGMIRDLAIAACNRFGGNDGRFNLDYFREAAQEEFSLPEVPSREWAKDVLVAADVAETPDGGFSWTLRNVKPIWRR